MENTNNTNKRRDLQLSDKPWIFPWQTERMLQRIQRQKLYLDQHILNESKNQTEKSSSSLDWLQKGIWYCLVKLNNKLPQNVQNNSEVINVIGKTMKTWRV